MTADRKSKVVLALKLTLVLIVAVTITAPAGAQGKAKPTVEYSKKATWFETLAVSWPAQQAKLQADQSLAGKLYPKDRDTWHLYLPKLFADFNSPEALRQIYRERADLIWDDFLRPGNGRLKTLAEGYAAHCRDEDKDLATKLASGVRDISGLVKVRNLYYRAMTVEALGLAGRTVDFVEQSVKLPTMRKQLGTLASKVKSADKSIDRVALYEQISALRRRIIFRHPALNFKTILINKHSPPLYSHNCDQYLARHARGGPGLTLLTNWKTAPKATSLLGDKLPTGDVNHPTLSPDARKVIFAYCCKSKNRADIEKHPGGYYIYEATTDGARVKQLTGTKSDKKETIGNRSTVEVEDFDPCYLPGGGFAFTSTRSQNYGRCHGARYTPSYLIYAADADGTNIRPISYAEGNEHFPSMLNDGRIVFTRWEYNNRNQIAFHKLWSIRPDGTGVANFYGVNSATPWAYNYHDARVSEWYDNVPPEKRSKILPYLISETRAIPGSRKVVATASGHHCFTSGTLIVIDPDKGEDGFAPITKLTPKVPYPEAEGWGYPGQYLTPSAISEDLFFAGYSPNPINRQRQSTVPWGHGIVLLDTLGGREPIYVDPAISCVSPLPLIPRKAPPVIPSQLPEATDDTATLIVQNVYITRDDPKGIIKKGDIKSLRIIEMLNLPSRGSFWAGEREDFARKIWGTVPVNDDGSVMFKVPARKTLYIQTLDKNGMALLTLRSLFHLMPGERRSCVGCHEPSGTPPVARFSAMKQAPKELTPPVGPQYPGGFSFKRTVQPVLDRYCIKCHGLEKSEGKLNLLAALGKTRKPRYTRAGRGGVWGYAVDYSDSWHSLITHPKLTKVAIRKSNFGATSESVNSRPKELFSHSGKLMGLLLKGHAKVKLDETSIRRLAAWGDMNYIRYGDYTSSDKPEWIVPDKTAEAELRAYTKALFGEKISAQPIQTLINVAQPDESRILKAPLPISAGGWGQIAKGYASTKDAHYAKMLKLVMNCTIPKQRK
ncbi:MAG: hypothetical protein HN350_11090 [Phycisphaerales bacterium]|nr:hypothetical protein [Phycisphaerales bacterium]